MIKGAQRKSMDPVQQRLRQSKSTWNKEVSAFINDLIHLKKLMNGWPNKFHKERSRITEPIPADPATILGSLAGDFQEIAQRGNALVQQQIQYSQNRRKPQPKTPEAPEAPTPAIPAAPATPPAAPPSGAQLTQQLAASLETKYGLVAEGSNPFTRFWTRLTTPKSGFGQKAQVRRLRMDLLKAALKSYRALGRLQVQVTRSSKQSVMDAYKEMKIAWDEWSVVSRNFNTYSNSLPDQPERTEQMREEGYSPEKEESELGQPPKAKAPQVSPELTRRVGQIIQDVKSVQNLLTSMDEQGLLRQLDESIQSFASNQGIDLKEFVAQYAATLAFFNQKFGTNSKTLKGALETYNKKYPSTRPLPDSQPPGAAASDQLEATAQAFLRKWLGKTRHQALPGKSSGLRIQVFDLAASARQNINQVMDLLEKGLDVDAIGPKMYDVTKQINTLRSLMRSLHNVEKPKGKGQQSPFEGIF